VYHADIECNSVPRRLRFPVLQYDWLRWPGYHYEFVIHDKLYVRCTHCIPDRRALYPLDSVGRRTGWRPGGSRRVRPGRRRHARKDAA
jgi:hypothetical protein